MQKACLIGFSFQLKKNLNELYLIVTKVNEYLVFILTKSKCMKYLSFFSTENTLRFFQIFA